MAIFDSGTLEALQTLLGTLALFLSTVAAPALFNRALKGEGREKTLRFGIRAAIFLVLAGGVAMYLGIMTWGHSRDYWTGWGVVFSAAGVLAAAPLVKLVLRCPWPRALRFTLIALAGQVLILVMTLSSFFLELALGNSFWVYYLICLAFLPFTWIPGPPQPKPGAGAPQ
jgi:hypothetical protein